MQHEVICFLPVGHPATNSVLRNFWGPTSPPFPIVQDMLCTISVMHFRILFSLETLELIPVSLAITRYGSPSKSEISPASIQLDMLTFKKKMTGTFKVPAIELQ
ncbi:hypothetical protein STEG23_037027, partial [Scotinomys teguina]